MTALDDLMARLGPPKEKESVEIQGLSIDEISGVSDPANGLPFLIMKSEAAGMSPAAREAAILKLKSLSYQKAKVKPKAGPNNPYFGELDPNNPYPLGPQGLPVAGGTVPPPEEAIDVKPPQEAINVSGEDAAFNASLANMKPHEAAALAVHPMTPPHRRILLRRRANAGKR